jgi:HTH-type transcriptional regulator, competence development regulator
MLTPYGKIIRKIRIDAECTLRDMAKKVGVTPAFLSAIETGAKAVPVNLIEKISQIFGLDAATKAELKTAAEQSRKEYKISPAQRDRELVAMFARQFDKIDEDQKARIKRILEGGKK